MQNNNSEHINPPKTCQRIKYKHFVNTETGEVHPISCKCYSCDVCGRIKRRKLFCALRDWLSQFDKVRMWTFTITTRYANGMLEHRKQLSECWHHFSRELRRCKLLDARQRNLQYVKVTEFHNAIDSRTNERKRVQGSHYHVFFSEYVNWHIINAVWEQSCSVVFAKYELVEPPTHQRAIVQGHVNVRAHSLSAAQAAGYVVKYVLKQIVDSSARIRRWSKSSKVSLFTKSVREVSANFIVVDVREQSELNLKHLRVTAQNLPPPDLSLFEICIDFPQNELENANDKFIYDILGVFRA